MWRKAIADIMGNIDIQVHNGKCHLATYLLYQLTDCQFLCAHSEKQNVINTESMHIKFALSDENMLKHIARLK